MRLLAARSDLLVIALQFLSVSSASNTSFVRHLVLLVSTPMKLHSCELRSLLPAVDSPLLHVLCCRRHPDECGHCAVMVQPALFPRLPFHLVRVGCLGLLCSTTSLNSLFKVNVLPSFRKKPVSGADCWLFGQHSPLLRCHIGLHPGCGCMQLEYALASWDGPMIMMCGRFA